MELLQKRCRYWAQLGKTTNHQNRNHFLSLKTRYQRFCSNQTLLRGKLYCTDVWKITRCCKQYKLLWKNGGATLKENVSILINRGKEGSTLHPWMFVTLLWWVFTAVFKWFSSLKLGQKERKDFSESGVKCSAPVRGNIYANIQTGTKVLSLVYEVDRIQNLWKCQPLVLT